jgi:hypothetical protein
MSNPKPILIQSLTILINLYVLSVVLAGSYFNWDYARSHGFGDWIKWGEIVPTGKALVWPYFLVRNQDPKPSTARSPESLSTRQINEMQIMSATRAINSALQANYIIDSRRSPLGSTEVQKTMEYASQALRSADVTDEEALNKLYPEFGTRFKKDFSEGQRLLISGLKNNSRDDLTRSSDLDRAWKDWYNAHRKQIEDAFNSALR